MKILFIHHRYHTNLFNWFRGFQENGHEVKLLVYKPDEVNQPDLPRSEHLPPSKWSVREMKKNPRKRGDGVDSFSPYYYPSVKTLYRYFKQENPDVVVIRPAFTRFGYRVLFLSLIFRCKILFYSQTHIYKHYHSLKKMVFEVAMSVLNAFWITPCLGDPKRFKYPPSRLIFFPFAIETTKNHTKEYSKDGIIRILCVAKYFTSKNPKLLLDAFFSLADKYSHIQLTICGSGDEKGDYFSEMKESVLHHVHGNRVNLEINLTYPEVQDLYKTHDVFVLPSNHDPASITNIEAMSYGLAVICSKANGTATYATHGKDGFLFERENIQELRHYLECLVSNPLKIKDIGKKAFMSMHENHHPLRVISQLLEQVK